MHPNHLELAAGIRMSVSTALRKAAGPERARQQQAYMKSSMPYFGVGVPQGRRIANVIFKANPVPNPLAWEAVILDMWRTANHREERYAAIGLLHFRAYSTWLEPARIPLIEEMVVTGAWWDYVDGIASKAVGTMLAAYPDQVKAEMCRWAEDDNIWKRRTSILCQLRAKGATDTGLLEDAIGPSIDSSEFFLRKAIGWALREYSKTNPAWVERYVSSRPDLSNLSRREALKHLRRAQKVNSRSSASPALD